MECCGSGSEDSVKDMTVYDVQACREDMDAEQEKVSADLGDEERAVLGLRSWGSTQMGEALMALDPSQG